MIPNYQHKYLIIIIFLFGTAIRAASAQDSTASPTILGISYFLPENKVPYLEISTKKKEGRIFEPVQHIPVNIYLVSGAEKELLGKIVTAENGKGIVAFPPSVKPTWDSLDEFTIDAESVPSTGSEALSADLKIKEAILVVDTALVDGARTVTGKLEEKRGNTWIPVKSVDMNLRIKRLLGNLSVGDADTYASDSTGVASAEYKRDSMPGDEKGNLTLVARVVDNDTYGNLTTEKIVPWGVVEKPNLNFFKQRTLWSTRFETPVWLLFLAYSIGGSVWIVIIYLIWQLMIIKKMGRNLPQGSAKEKS